MNCIMKKINHMTLMFGIIFLVTNFSMITELQASPAAASSHVEAIFVVG